MIQPLLGSLIKRLQFTATGLNPLSSLMHGSQVRQLILT